MKGNFELSQKHKSFIKVNSGPGSLYEGSPNDNEEIEDFGETYSLAERRIKYLDDEIVSVNSDYEDYYSSIGSEFIQKKDGYNSGFTFSKEKKYEFLKSLEPKEKELFLKKEEGINELIRMQDELNDEVENELANTEKLLRNMPETSPSFYNEESSILDPNNISNDINSFDYYSNNSELENIKFEKTSKKDFSNYKIPFGRDSDFDYSKDNSGDGFRKHIHLLKLNQEELRRFRNSTNLEEEEYWTPNNNIDLRKKSTGGQALTRFETRFRTMDRSRERDYESNTFCFDNILFSNENLNRGRRGIEKYRTEVEVKPYIEISDNERNDDIHEREYYRIENDDFNFSETEENFAARFKDLDIEEKNDLFENEMMEFIQEKDDSQLLRIKSLEDSQILLDKAYSSPVFERRKSSDILIHNSSMDNTMFPHSIHFDKQYMSITDLENNSKNDQSGELIPQKNIDRTKKKEKLKLSGKKTSRRIQKKKRPPTPSSFISSRVNTSEPVIRSNEEEIPDNPNSLPIFKSKYIKMSSKERKMIKDFNNTIDLNMKNIQDNLEVDEELIIEDLDDVNLGNMQQKIYLDYYKDNIDTEDDKNNFKSTLHRSIPSMGHEEDRLKRYFLETMNENEIIEEEEEETKRRNDSSSKKRRENEDQIGLIYVVKEEVDNDFCKREIRMEINQIYVNESNKGKNDTVTSSGGSKKSEMNMLSQRNYDRIINSKCKNQLLLTDLDAESWAMRRIDSKSDSRNLSQYELNLEKMKTPLRKKNTSKILRYQDDIYFVKQKEKESAENRFTKKLEECELFLKNGGREDILSKNENNFNPLDTENHKDLLRKINNAVKNSHQFIRYEVNYLD